MTATTTRRRRPPRPMCPVTKTDFFPGRSGRLECWGAISGDGVWHFTREESPGTPWLIYHWPSVQDKSYELPVTLTGTLNAAREHVERGLAITELGRRKAAAAGWEWTGAAWRHKSGAIAPGGFNDPPAPGAPA